MSTTFADVVAVKPLSSHTYGVDLQDEWCIGTVPNGGYTTSTFLMVARTHMQHTHPKRAEPHPISLHLEFLRRTSATPALFTVKDIKLGSRISNLHITLSQKQPNGKYVDEVEGYITMSNMDGEAGLSLPTEHKLYPPALPADLVSLLSTGEDENWLLRRKDAFPDFRRATKHIRFHLMRPERRPADRPKSIGDQWVRFSPNGNPGKWTNDCLGFVVDMFPQIIESYVNPVLEEAALANQNVKAVLESQTESRAKYWYPTLSLNLDVKKLLPDEGVEWLFVRVRAKVIKNGRFDLDVEVRDASDDLVAVSSHCSLIMGTERNTGGSRSKKESKI